MAEMRMRLGLRVSWWVVPLIRLLIPILWIAVWFIPAEKLKDMMARFAVRHGMKFTTEVIDEKSEGKIQ